MRAAARILAIVLVGLLGGGLPAAGARRAPASSTLGTNALPMRTDVATYRLSLDGTAALAGSAPPSSLSMTTTSPGGRYRFEVDAAGLAFIDARTGARRILTTSLYAQRPYWSPSGQLAFTDRISGLTRLVVFNPATSERRVVASHVCGDALVDPWAPDGNSLAVAVSPLHSGCNGHGGMVVAVSDATGGGMRRITAPQTTPVTWTRDGTELLIAEHDSAGVGRSRLVDPQTGKGRLVLPSYGPLLGGTWSSGRRFFAALAVNLAQARQVVIVVDGALRRVVESLGYTNSYAWAPRRQWLAIASQTNIRVFDAWSGRVVATIPAHTPYGLSVQTLAWSPNGRTMTIAASPSPGHD